MSRRARPVTPLAALSALSALAMLLAGCGGYDQTTAKAQEQAAPAPPAPPATTPAACVDDPDPTRSYEPTGPLPAAGDLPAGSTMAEIRRRGRLVAGVSADTFLLASNNPLTGKIEGFDIDLVEQVAKAILGDPKAYELKVITAADRIKSLQDQTVDIVVRNMTINCVRWQSIAFSAEYYRAGQKILVRQDLADKGVDTVEELAGVAVCAPTGTSSLENIKERAPGAFIEEAANHTGCLALFQRGTVDAITGDDTVLAGLAAQDPYAVVPPQKAFTEEPYGIGVNADDKDLVRFVNGVLERMRADGSWQASYARWLQPVLNVPATQPKPVYGRTP